MKPIHFLSSNYIYDNYSAAQTEDVMLKYVKLLAIQYTGKRKARATIASWVLTMLTSTGTINTVAYNGFNLATAKGILLDNIGKIVGIDRNYVGNYTSVIGDGQQLYDEPYRELIATKIVSNYNACTYESTAKGFYELYRGTVLFDANGDMSMTIYAPSKIDIDLISIAIQKNGFLIALGVQVNYVIINLPAFAFLDYFLVENPSYISTGVTGFSDYLDFNIKEGNSLTYADILF